MHSPAPGVNTAPVLVGRRSMFYNPPVMPKNRPDRPNFAVRPYASAFIANDFNAQPLFIPNALLLIDAGGSCHCIMKPRF